MGDLVQDTAFIGGASIDIVQLRRSMRLQLLQTNPIASLDITVLNSSKK